MEIPEKCIACNQDSLTRFGARQGYVYWQCTQCGSLQLYPMPEAHALERQYADEYLRSGHLHPDPVLRNQAAMPYYRALLSVLGKHAKPDANVLEVGAGWGGLVDLLTQAGYFCEGLEPIPEMAHYASNQNLPVTQGDLFTYDRTDETDVLMLSAVFEHLVKPDAWLARASEVLSDHGLLITLQPTARFATLFGQLLRCGIRWLPLPKLHEVFCPPWHVALYSESGLQQLAQRHGFKLKAIYPAPQGRSKGLAGKAQCLLQWINTLGIRLMGTRWPLLICHIFVFEKRDTP